MGAASMPVTGAATGMTGGGTTARSVTSREESSSCLARLAAPMAKSEPSVAIKALDITSSFPTGGADVLDQLGQAHAGVQAARRRHHVGTGAAEGRRLHARLGLPIDAGAPPLEPDEEHGRGAEPAHEALDSLGALSILVCAQVGGAFRRSLH